MIDKTSKRGQWAAQTVNAIETGDADSVGRLLQDSAYVKFLNRRDRTVGGPPQTHGNVLINRAFHDAELFALRGHTRNHEAAIKIARILEGSVRPLSTIAATRGESPK